MNNTPLSEYDFIEAGYKRYSANSVIYAEFLLQKAVYNDEGQKKYFVTIYAYDMSAIGQSQFNFELNSQFRNDDGQSYNVVGNIKTIKEAENLMEKLWKSFGERNYE